MVPAVKVGRWEGSFGESQTIVNDMGVSKNKGTPKWVVYHGKFIKMDDLGVPLFLETSIFGNNCILIAPPPKKLTQ